MPHDKTMVSYDSETHLIDTVEHGGQTWLVPAWLDGEEPGTSRPLRMIPLGKLYHQPLTDISVARYLVTSPLPGALFAPAPLPQDLIRRYGVVENPPLRSRGGAVLDGA